MPLRFSIHAQDHHARTGRITTAHGAIDTPAFMPVGTRGAVTGLEAAEVAALGAQVILGNTYHLALRPGLALMRQLGGLHRLMGWSGSILTDSGGYQIFSLAEDRTVSEAGARFVSYVDGRAHELTPESAVAMQEAIGSDIMMALDVCPPSLAPEAEVAAAMQRTHRWAVRSLAARSNPEQALFAIVQGGLSPTLRAESAAFLTQHAFDGFALGGLAVGDSRAQRRDVIAATASALPADKPRYLMGVGTPPDILEAIGQGIDMFDCVLPTSLAFQGTAFTSTGRVRLLRSEHRAAEVALDAACACATCRTHSRAYLHHLFKARETLLPRLLAVHNLYHYLQLMRDARAAIAAGTYAAFAARTLSAIDRHEHAEADAPAAAAPARFALVTTSSGAPAVLDRAVGEVMHPGLGAALESQQLYVAQAQLAQRLATPGPELVLFDVGLGAGSNAIAALRCARDGRRPLRIVSFEHDLGALHHALAHAEALGWSVDDVAAARALAADGEHRAPGVCWQLCAGDVLAALRDVAVPADVVFWDPFSPKANPALWTVAAFTALRARCAPGAVLFTYSRSTAVRTALLLAGFEVGAGDAVGHKETTAAAVPPGHVARPLDSRWLARLARSAAPWPVDAPDDASARVAGAAQFRAAPATS